MEQQKTKSKDKRVKPEKVVQILSDHGEDITLEEAEILLNFLYELAPVALRQHLCTGGKPAATNHGNK
ncbi:hypothetical protein OOZ15_13735 [Galbibacter sp. EGI 63066]|nr:hypothetical protein [Galbibacter sp. EGI 63066]